MRDRPLGEAGQGPRPQRTAEEIFGRARDLSGAERASYVEAACRGDPALEREVLDLLERSDPADVFFRRLGLLVDPLRSRAGRAMRREEAAGADVRDAGNGLADREGAGPDAPELPPGAEVGPYRILDRIGSGGMGTVYSARDSRLDRNVALKFLPPWLAADPRAAERFRHEARAAAALDHPNICTVYEIGEERAGRPYIAMALYRGETLRARLERGPLPVDEAVRVAVAVARALAAAHARGIVHRDVKPGNVMLTTDGRVKLLDFGLARLEDVALTRPGLLRGTVSYMAPEQVRGDPAGPAADLWALGVVMYEMLAGRRPFSGGRDRARFHAILHEEPPPLGELRPEVPEALVRTVERLLRKDSADRYAGATELLAALTEPTAGRSRTRDPDARPAGSASGRRHSALRTALRRASLALAGAVIVALTAFAAWRLRGGGGPALDDQLVAVLPFRISGEDPSLAYLREGGMMELVEIELQGTPDARVAEESAVLTALHDAGATDEGAITRATAVRVAREVGAGHALLGSVASLPGRMTVQAHLYDASDRRADTTVIVEGSSAEPQAVVDGLVGRVLGLRAGEGRRLRSLTTDSLSALRLYLKGKAAYRGGRYDEAARDFVGAVRIDSSFALAAFQAWLAAESGSGRGSPGAAALLGRAWRHRDRLAPRDSEFVVLITGRNGPDDSPSGQQLLANRQQLTRRQPRNPQAWYMLGIYTVGAERSLGVSDSAAFAHAMDALEHAVAADSTFLPAYSELWNLAVARADTAALRRYDSLFRARSPTGMGAETFRCVETALDRDRPSVARIMARADSVGGAVPGRCLFFYHHLPMLSAVRDSAEDLLWRQYRWDLGPLGRSGAGILHDVELDAGRPAHAAPILAAYVRAFGSDSLTDLEWRIRYALWWDADRREAEGSVDALADTLAADPPETAGTPASSALCVLGEWRLSEGDTARANPIIRKLRALGGDGGLPGQTDALYCTRALMAWRAAERGAADAGARIDSLAHNRGGGPNDRALYREGYLIAARLLERRGDPSAALTAIRHAAATMPPIYMSTVLRTRGRLAAEIGDTAQALDAYCRYLALRTRPEPALRAQVEGVRKALEALGG